MNNQEDKVLIKDVLERIKEVSLPTTAKELHVGRDRLQAFLRENECEHIRGHKEWRYKGDNPAFLEWNLYDYVHKTGLRGTKPKSKQINKVNKITKKEVEKMENKVVNISDNQENNEVIEEEKKKVTYELPISLHEEYRIKAIRERKTVSELVEMAMQQYLQGN